MDHTLQTPKITAHDRHHDDGFITVMANIYRCHPVWFDRSLIYKTGKKYITSPINSVQTITPDLLTEIRTLCDRNGASAHLSTLTPPDDGQGFETAQNNLLTILNLNDAPEDRMSFYKSRHRSKVRASYKHADHLTFAWGCESDLKDWFAILQNLYRTKHRMITQPYALYRGLLQSGLGHLLIVRNHHGVMLGGLFMLIDHQEWEYGWGAATPKGQDLGVMSLLMDQAIAGAIQANSPRFNFGASPMSDQNLRFFKTRWGAQEYPITHLFYNRPAILTDLNESYPTIRRLIPFVPNPILGLVSRVAVPWLI